MRTLGSRFLIQAAVLAPKRQHSPLKGQRDTGHRRRLRSYRRTAIRTEPAHNVLTAVALLRIGLWRASKGKGRLRHRDDDVECRAGLLLAVLAMAHPGKHWLGRAGIAHLAA